MTRDSARTRKKIIEALGLLLAENGFEGVGINAVARRAGVDKVLIYRYFGGLPQLLKAYAEEGGFWPDWGETTGLTPDELAGIGLRDLARRVLAGHLNQLRLRPLTQEIMRWELMTRNELTDGLARTREETTGELLEMLGRSTGEPEMDEFLALGAVLHAGLTYLVLRSKTADVYMGVDLTAEEGWQRLGRAVETLIEAYFDRIEARSTLREED